MKTKTKFIKKLIKISFIVLFVLINISYIGTAKAAVSSSALVSMANSSRAQEGMGNLSSNAKLESAAFAKANDIIEKDYFAHTSPDGKTPWDFISNSGYSYVYAGENLAIGYSDSSELHNAWMNSPSHRDNIMNPNFREIGVAVLSGEYEGSQATVVVQMFGSTSYEEPATQSEPQVAASADEGSAEEQAPESNNQPIEAKTKEFNLIMEKTGYSPDKIFADEEVNFKVALTGEATEIFYTVGEQKIDLKESVQAVKDSLEKTFEKKEKIQKEGDFPVSLTVVDKWGNREAKDLGKLTVAKKVINKENQSDSTWIGAIKNFGRDNIGIITLVMTLLSLGAIGYLGFRWQKHGRFA